MNKQEELLKSAINKVTPDVWDGILRGIEASAETVDINMAAKGVPVTDVSVAAKGVPTEARADARGEAKAVPTRAEIRNEVKAEREAFKIVDGGKTETGSESTTYRKKARKTGKPAPWYTRMIFTAACALLVLGGVWGFNGYKVAHAVDSRISLDVNPSIEITMNSKERVLDCIATNEDAEKIIGDMDFRGSDIDVAINALIGSLLRNGYIDEAKNSILVSVDNKNHEKGEALRQRLLDEISSILQDDGIEGAVLSRAADPEEDAELVKIAEEYGISVAKAQLIMDIVDSNPKYKFEDLAGLSINELNLLADSPQVELHHVQSTGKASDKGYIGYDKAHEIAFKAAGLGDGAAAQVVGLESEMEYEGGRMAYEIEFEAGGAEYEFDIDALTGEIINQEIDTADGYDDHDDDMDDDDDNDIDDDDDDDDDDHDDDHDDDDDDDDDDQDDDDDDDDRK